MKVRTVAILLVVMQLSGIFLAGLASVDLQGNTAADELSPAAFKVVSNTSAVFAVVNKNLFQQMKLITGLSDVSSSLAGKALPKPQKNKPQKDTSQTCLLPFNSFNLSKQIIETNTLSDSYCVVNVMECIAIIAFVIILYLSVRRHRFRKCYYLLPRGSIDDYIMAIQIVFWNPCWLMVNRDFSFDTAGTCHA